MASRLVRCGNVTQLDDQGGGLNNMRLTMKSNLKVILSAVGVAALLASPAMAQTKHVRHHTRAQVTVPYDAYDSVAPYQAPAIVRPNANFNRRDNNLNPDFQLGGDN
jgi:hypothetical protein